MLLDFLESHFERDQIHLHLLDRLGSRDLCYRIIDRQLAMGATAFKHEQLRNAIVSNGSFVDYILQQAISKQGAFTAHMVIVRHVLTASTISQMTTQAMQCHLLCSLIKCKQSVELADKLAACLCGLSASDLSLMHRDVRPLQNLLMLSATVVDMCGADRVAQVMMMLLDLFTSLTCQVNSPQLALLRSFLQCQPLLDEDEQLRQLFAVLTWYLDDLNGKQVTLSQV